MLLEDADGLGHLDPEGQTLQDGELILSGRRADEAGHHVLAEDDVGERAAGIDEHATAGQGGGLDNPAGHGYIGTVHFAAKDDFLVVEELHRSDIHVIIKELEALFLRKHQFGGTGRKSEDTSQQDQKTIHSQTPGFKLVKTG